MSEKLQMIFDRTATAIIEQGGPSVKYASHGKGITCVYRSPDGRKCAAGLWIKDEFYTSDLEGPTLDEGKSVHMAIVSSYPNLEFGPGATDAYLLLASLQNAHDGAALEHWRYREDPANFSFMERFRSKMIAVASQFSLNPGIVDNV